MELNEAPGDRKKLFQCSTCPPETKKIRRCMEKREDFTDKDGVMWPMYVTKDGNFYSYCPGKATWDIGAVSIYQALVIAAETGIMYEDGPISKQPHWWVELLAWFLPQYRDKIFWTRAKIILGSDKAQETAQKLF